MYNIGIHVPRKDKCIKCERYNNLKEKNLNDIDSYNLHVAEKEAAKKIFLGEQARSAKEDFLVVSLDLQKVLATPHGDTMLLGFSRKYAVYNFTTYESETRRGTCYIWGEKDGKRGPNEIASNLYDYLTKIDFEGKFKTLALYCDNCGGQNKNRYVLSMIRYFLDNSDNIETINLNFLITGHTYMPADSMHAVIENHIKKSIVQASSEWPTVLRNARKTPEPYAIEERHYTDFLDFKSLPLEKGLKIRISDIRRATFQKQSNLVTYTNSFLHPEDSRFEIKIKAQSKLFKFF